MTEEPNRRAEVVRKAISMIEERLDSGHVTGTIADLVRLLQIEKEFADERPIEVRVTWVESSETESAINE